MTASSGARAPRGKPFSESPSFVVFEEARLDPAYEEQSVEPSRPYTPEEVNRIVKQYDDNVRAAANLPPECILCERHGTSLWRLGPVGVHGYYPLRLCDVHDLRLLPMPPRQLKSATNKIKHRVFKQLVSRSVHVVQSPHMVNG